MVADPNGNIFIIKANGLGGISRKRDAANLFAACLLAVDFVNSIGYTEASLSAALAYL